MLKDNQMLDAGEHPPSKGLMDFRKFVYERHRMYIKYKVKGFPKDTLTNDYILHKYKFTNVFRELDTGTIWCRKNIREIYANNPELFFNIALYRVYNRIRTAEVIGYIRDYPNSGAEDRVRELYATGTPVFTGAYMLTGTLGGDKIHQVFGKCANYLWDHRRELEPKLGDTLKQAFDRLIAGKIPGIGPFIAYEIVSDLRWTRYLENAKDINSWANPGPGAKRGIMRVYQLPVKTQKMSKEERQEIRNSYPSSPEGMIRVMRYIHMIMKISNNGSMPDMEMRDIEHSLCEFDKYERVRLGEGRPRSVFNPS